MEKHFKQLIIARRDLNMSPSKLAAQVSSAFLIEMIRDSWPEKVQDFYQVNYRLDKVDSPFLGYLNMVLS